MQKQQRRHVVLDWEPKRASAGRGCDHPGCTGGGDYRAPKARDPGGGHWWFCLDHVRDYNRAWDFFAGMSQADIEDYQRKNATWHRPTWRLGERIGADVDGVWVRDDLGLLAEVELDKTIFGGKRSAAPPKNPEERQALAALDLQPHVSLAEIKTRYKELAKRFHPDTHGGDKDAEERFKQINQAYTYLLSCGYT